MTVFLDTVYPVVLAASAVLVLFGVVTLVWMRAHSTLGYAVKGYVLIIGVEVLAVLFAVVAGGPPIVITVAYLIAAIALLPLLGIGRLGTPEAAKNDPGRPVLQPDQIARVDAGAAILVAGAQAVVAWRLAEIMSAAL
jgi:hypothetical protein